MKTDSRQRMLDAFNYNYPDKIPVVYHPSSAGLYVHGQKLIDLFNRYPSDNPINFDKIPDPGPNAFDENGKYHQFITDEWGTQWEYRIFGIAGHPKHYPFASWKAALENYSFPPLSPIDSPTFIREQIGTIENRNHYLIFDGWISIFERLHALRPFEEMLMNLCTYDEDILAFIDKLTEYWISVIDRYIALETDVFVFGDDWGTQNSTLISPEMFRNIFKPRYRKLFDRIQTRPDGLIFLHCCGYMGELLDEFVELGIRGLWPQIGIYDKDENFTAKCKENKIAVYIHPDRQHLIPLGTPREIRNYVKAAARKYQKLGGGGIFYVEIENDAPFENVKALIESIHEYR